MYTLVIFHNPVVGTNVIELLRPSQQFHVACPHKQSNDMMQSAETKHEGMLYKPCSRVMASTEVCCVAIVGVDWNTWTYQQ